MIAVLGEALIDLVVGANGSPAGGAAGGDGVGGGVSARLGGGPYNTARTVGRLGQPAAFFGRLSDDVFGRLLRGGLDEAGVTLGLPGLTQAPTTLSIASVGPSGGAEYRFYLAGTSAADVEYKELAGAFGAAGIAVASGAGGEPGASGASGAGGVPEAAGDGAPPGGLTAVHAGSLGLLMEPAAASAEQLITTGLPDDALVMVDPNCRPGAVTGRPAFLARLLRILRRADVVKVSTEDLAYISPGTPLQRAAAELLGAGPALVLVTDGPRPARAVLPGQEIAVDVPPVRVVDTIGAGDAFGGAFLAWWSAQALTRADLSEPGAVRGALRAAAEVASLTCARPGADPPWLAEVRSFSPEFRVLPVSDLSRAAGPRLLAVSDLHVGHPANRRLIRELPGGDAGDWLLVAGDVGEQFADIEWALRLLSKRYATVVWVPGNHELWTRRADPVTVRGVERYRLLVDACRDLGVVTPEDPYPVWNGPGGPATVVPLFLGYDYTFLPDGAFTKEEGLALAYRAGVVCTDEHLLHPDPYPSREAWCHARTEETRCRLAAELDPALPVIFVNHYPLVREPTRILRYPQFAQWCGTTRTADWHVRYNAAAVVYGHLHIPRVTWHDGVRFEEVSVGYPREWQRRAARFGIARPSGPWQILPAPAPALVPAPPGAPEGLRA